MKNSFPDLLRISKHTLHCCGISCMTVGDVSLVYYLPVAVLGVASKTDDLR